MGYALLVVLVFMTGQGQQFSAKFPTMEDCKAELATVAPKIANHNQKAPPPSYIVFYSAACAEINEAPKGKDA